MLKQIMKINWTSSPGIRGLSNNDPSAVADRKRVFEPIWNKTWNKTYLDVPPQSTGGSNNGQ